MIGLADIRPTGAGVAGSWMNMSVLGGGTRYKFIGDFE